MCQVSKDPQETKTRLIFHPTKVEYSEILIALVQKNPRETNFRLRILIIFKLIRSCDFLFVFETENKYNKHSGGSHIQSFFHTQRR